MQLQGSFVQILDTYSNYLLKNAQAYYKQS